MRARALICLTFVFAWCFAGSSEAWNPEGNEVGVLRGADRFDYAPGHLAPDGAGPCQQTPVARDCVHIVVDIDPMELPLAPATTYGLVVLDGLRGAGGEEVVPMPIGHLMTSELPVAIGGVSQIGSIDDELIPRCTRTDQIPV